MELEAVRLAVPFGALDLATVAEFGRWARERIDAGGPSDARAGVVLDLTDVEFVMAAGIQALLDLEGELTAAGRVLTVANAAPIVVRVLDICGLAERWLVA